MKRRCLTTGRDQKKPHAFFIGFILEGMAFFFLVHQFLVWLATRSTYSKAVFFFHNKKMEWQGFFCLWEKKTLLLQIGKCPLPILFLLRDRLSLSILQFCRCVSNIYNYWTFWVTVKKILSELNIFVSNLA